MADARTDFSNAHAILLGTGNQSHQPRDMKNQASLDSNFETPQKNDILEANYKETFPLIEVIQEITLQASSAHSANKVNPLQRLY